MEIDDRGIVLIAYGDSAIKNMYECVGSIRKFAKRLPIMVITDRQLDFDDKHTSFQIALPDNGDEIVDLVVASREQKVRLDKLTPYRYTLYMDVDCRVRHVDFMQYFEAIADGFDFAITPSTVQDDHWAQHTTPKDRAETLKLIGFTPIQMQCGVFSFKTTTTRAKRFWVQWRKEYGLYSNKDQLAFTRALFLKPMKVAVLAPVFNNGAVIQHLFGALSR